MTMTTDRPTATPAPGGSPSPAARPAAPPRAGDDIWSVLSTTSVMVCLVAGWMVAQLLYLGGIAQDRAQDELYQQLRADLAAGTAPIGPVTEVGTPVATISIPHIGVEQVVVEGTASGDLLVGPGHLRNTVLPASWARRRSSVARGPTARPSLGSPSWSPVTRSTSPPHWARSGSR